MRWATSLRVLDEIGRRVEAAGHQDHIVGDLLALQIFPFMRVARVGRLEQDRLRPRLDRDVEHRGERDVVGVRPLVIAPADVQPHAVGRDVARSRG